MSQEPRRVQPRNLLKIRSWRDGSTFVDISGEKVDPKSNPKYSVYTIYINMVHIYIYIVCISMYIVVYNSHIYTVMV